MKSCGIVYDSTESFGCEIHGPSTMGLWLQLYNLSIILDFLEKFYDYDIVVNIIYFQADEANQFLNKINVY